MNYACAKSFPRCNDFGDSPLPICRLTSIIHRDVFSYDIAVFYRVPFNMNFSWPHP